MNKWTRPNFMPCLPLGNNHSRITECTEHKQLSRMAATEGTVLLKNDNALLPFKKGTNRRLQNAASRINTALFVTKKQTTPHRIWYNRVD